MDENTHVYCTKCLNIRYDTYDGGTPFCRWDDQCGIEDSEDSRPFKERPHYISKKSEKHCDIGVDKL